MNQYAINMPNNALYPLAPHERVYNFSPGPSMLPTEVLAVAQAELLNYRGSGMSVMEISHRSSLFDEIMAHTIADFKTLMQVPDDYHILFTQGGASALNSLVPLNLLGQQTVEGAQAQAAQAAQALYAVTGYWSNKTFQEAKRYSQYAEINSVYTAATPYQTIDLCNAQTSSWALPSAMPAKYLHVCSNETIDGIQLKSHHLSQIAKAYAGTPLVVDVSSDVLSQALNVADFGVLYGGAQKNIGIAGLTFVIVHKQLLTQALSVCPTALNWQAIAQSNSLLNTPPTFAIYLAGLVFKHWLAKGGLPYLQTQAELKAKLLYQTIDDSQLYHNAVDVAYRSNMNVVFNLKDESHNAAFLVQAAQQGLMNLKGHKQVGGMRASIYNAMPLAGVEALVAFMQTFEASVA